MKMPAQAIREEILKSGAISFARFMELALYCPETGYYEAKRDIVGRGGDFITSVSTGSFFGELLAFQFAAWLAELPPTGKRPAIVEAGAHDGKLARDILAWLQLNRPDLYTNIRYIIMEPSSRRQTWQQELLESFKGVVEWVLPAAAAREKISGIIFSNELLDAFPVRRLAWDAIGKKWFEWGVTAEGGRFCWTKIALPPGESDDLCPAALQAVLPDGYVMECSPQAEVWWRDAAAMLGRGRLVAIDYGHSAEEFFSPARTRGSLRAYHRHHVSDDLLANPGEQDLTAHVHFGAIEKAGESAGLRTDFFGTQLKFLTRILKQAVAGGYFDQLEPKQVRQFQTLTHPEHLGRAFRTLVQAR